MFCPRCSQEQVSDEVRFCPRCGFQLGVVRMLLAEGPTPEAPAAPQKVSFIRSLRKRDLTIGAMLMFVVAFMVAVVTVDLPPSHSAPILMLAVAWFLLSLLINAGPLFRYLFGAGAPEGEGKASLTQKAPARGEVAAGAQRSLPRSYAQPGGALNARPANTAEVVQPPSVTEQTTNLLNDGR